MEPVIVREVIGRQPTRAAVVIDSYRALVVSNGMGNAEVENWLEPTLWEGMYCRRFLVGADYALCGIAAFGKRSQSLKMPLIVVPESLREQ